MRFLAGAFLLGIAVGRLGAAEIPKTLSAGDFTVSAGVVGNWAVKVNAQAGVIQYSSNNYDLPIEVTVFRVELPKECGQMDVEAVGQHCIKKDALKFKKPVFRHPLTWPKRFVTATYPAGQAVVFDTTCPVASGAERHYARAALLLPSDYRTRRRAYLVVGHQVGGANVQTEQNRIVNTLLEGLRERSLAEASGSTP